MQNGIDKSEFRKEQIKTAAMRCFSKFGYNKTTMDDIANAIGMKKASLYYYYKNKENIVCETIESEVHNFFKTAKERLLKTKSASKKLYKLVEYETEYFKEKVGAFELSVSTLLEAQPVINEMMEKVRTIDVDMWASILKEGIDKGEFRNCNAKKVADTIRTVLDSIKFREFHQSKVLAANEINYEKIKKTGRDMIDLITKGLKKC